MLNLRKGSTEQEWAGFFATLHELPVAAAVPSRAAFSKARQGLSEKAFSHLNRLAIEAFRGGWSTPLWHGCQLLAVDGTTFRSLPAREVRSTRRVVPGRRRRVRGAVAAQGPQVPERAKSLCTRIRYAVEPFVGAVVRGFPTRKSGAGADAGRPGHRRTCRHFPSPGGTGCPRRVSRGITRHPKAVGGGVGADLQSAAERADVGARLGPLRHRPRLGGRYPSGCDLRWRT